MNNLLGQFEWKGPQEVPKIGCVQHDCDECKSAPSKTEIIKDLHQQLLSKQLEIKRLREALSLMVTYAREEGKGLRIADEALQTPPDDSALREYVAGEMVKAAESYGASVKWFVDYAERYRKGEV